MQPGGQPIVILGEGSKRESGKDAQSNNIQAARAIANTIKTTLGPKGMDKMLIDAQGDSVITNDGAAILNEVDVEHPAAKMLIEVAKAQDAQCGDGTTTSVVLAGALLAEAEELLEKGLHPTVITRGFQQAAERANRTLESIAKEVASSGATQRKMIRNAAMTSLASKAAGQASEHLADLIVEVVSDIAEDWEEGTIVDLDHISVLKATGGNVMDTQMVDGIAIDKTRVHEGMPQRVEDARIALVNQAFEVKKTEVDADIQITDPEQLQGFLAGEEDQLRALVARLHEIGANVVVCQKGIDDLAQHWMAKNGILAVRRAKKTDLDKLSLATGGNVVSSILEMTEEDLGSAGVVEERRVGDETFTFVSGCHNPHAVSIILRGGTEHVVDELERAMDDALNVAARTMEDAMVTPGGGAAASHMAMELRGWAPRVGGREQLAVEAFAQGLEAVPRTLAENAGLDEIEILMALRKAHKDGRTGAGVNVREGKVADMFRMGVVEPLSVGRQQLASAVEAATMILRIDDVISSKGSGGDGGAGGPPGGMPPGMGGMGGMGGGMPMM
jgi:archaeal chaperonin